MKKILSNKILFYIILFLLFVFLCFLFPYTHDDYAWGSGIGIYRLYTLFDDYNGRWLGNLMVLILTRNLLIKSIVMSLVLVLIFYYIEKIIGKKNNSIIRLLSPTLFFLMPVALLRQGVVWTSAFSNYVFPILFFLIYLNYNKDIFSKDNDKNKIPAIFLLILGFICSLFIENITLFNLFLSFVIVIYLLIKNKKIHLPNLMYFIGSLIGTIIMFSNGAYHSVANGADEYRSLDILGNASNNILNTIVDYFTFKNVFLNMIISIVIILIISLVYKKMKSRMKSFIPLIILILLSYPIYALFINYYSVNILLNYTKYFNALFSLIYLLTIFICIFLFINKKEEKYKLMTLCIIIIGITCPLVIVTPIGPRCFIPSYILFILLVGLLLNYYLSNIKYNEFILRNVICSSFIVLFCFYSLVYGYIYKVNVQREKYIKDHINDSQLVLPKLPHKTFVYGGYPEAEVFVDRFKLFYNIDEKCEVKFVSYKEWKNNIINKKK